MSIHIDQNAFFNDAYSVNGPEFSIQRRRDNIIDNRWPEGWWLLPMVACGGWLWWSFFAMVLS